MGEEKRSVSHVSSSAAAMARPTVNMAATPSAFSAYSMVAAMAPGLASKGHRRQLRDRIDLHIAHT